MKLRKQASGVKYSPAARDDEPAIDGRVSTQGQPRDLTANPDGAIAPLVQEIGGVSSVTLIASDHPAVSKVARVQIKPGSSTSYGNTVRLLMADTSGTDPAPPSPTLDYAHAFAIRLPSHLNDGGFPRTGLVWELHNTAAFYNYSGPAALAPHALLIRPNRVLANRCCTGPLSQTGWTEWHPEDKVIDLKPDAWLDVVHRCRFSEAKDGLVEVFAWWHGSTPPTAPQLRLQNVCTAQSIPQANPPLHNDRLYLECGFYLDGASSTNRNDTIDHTLPRRFTGATLVTDAIAWLAGSAPPQPPQTYSYASSVKTGDVIVDGHVWTVTSDDPACRQARFFADNVELERVAWAEGKASTTLHLPPTSDNGGVTLHDPAGAMLWGSGSIDWTVEAPPDPPDPTPDTYDVTGTATVDGDEITLQLKLT